LLAPVPLPPLAAETDLGGRPRLRRAAGCDASPPTAAPGMPETAVAPAAAVAAAVAVAPPAAFAAAAAAPAALGAAVADGRLAAVGMPVAATAPITCRGLLPRLAPRPSAGSAGCAV